MTKEILFYNPIYSFTVEDYINTLEAAKNDDIKVRMNTPGGDVYAAYGAIAKFNEHSKGKAIHVDGEASSGGAFICFAAKGSGNEVTCLDVSQFLIHRAAFSSWIEDDPKRFTDALKKEITSMNKSLRGLIEKVCSADKFMAITGTSLDVVFSMESRVDVQLDAMQAQQLGLVSRLIPLTASKKSEIVALASQYGIAAFNPKSNINSLNTNVMTEIKTIKDFKAAYPDAYSEFKKELVKDTLEAERARIDAWEEWREIDAKVVIEGIKSGKELTTKDISIFSKKALAKNGLTAIAEGNAPEIQTPELTPEAKTAKDLEAKAIIDAARKELGLDATKKPKTVIYS